MPRSLIELSENIIYDNKELSNLMREFFLENRNTDDLYDLQVEYKEIACKILKSIKEFFEPDYCFFQALILSYRIEARHTYVPNVEENVPNILVFFGRWIEKYRSSKKEIKYTTDHTKLLLRAANLVAKCFFFWKLDDITIKTYDEFNLTLLLEGFREKAFLEVYYEDYWQEIYEIVVRIEKLLLSKKPALFKNLLLPSNFLLIAPYLVDDFTNKMNTLYDSFSSSPELIALVDTELSNLFSYLNNIMILDPEISNIFTLSKTIIVEKPEIFKKNLLEDLSSKISNKSHLLNLSAAIDDWIIKSKIPLNDDEIFNYLEKETTFLQEDKRLAGITTKKNGFEYFITGPFFLRYYWWFIEALLSGARDFLGLKFSRAENRTIDQLSEDFEERSWNALQKAAILPNQEKNRWIYGIPAGAFGNSRQIDFIGIFLHRDAYYICVGDIKSIRGPKTSIELFQVNYERKLNDGCIQVEESKQAIIDNFDEFIRYIATRVDSKAKTIINSLKSEKIIKAIFPVPRNIYKPRDDDIWIINETNTKEQSLKELDFVLSFQKGKIRIFDEDFHLFEWIKGEWVEVIGIKTSQDIKNRLNLQNPEELTTDIQDKLRKGEFRVFKKSVR